MNWIYTQLVLTGRELKLEITIPHIVSGLVFFVIIHRISRTPSEVQKFRKRTVRQHVYDKHPSKLKHCTDGQCQKLRPDTKDAITASMINEMAL